MLDPLSIAIIILTFLVAGTVKGIVGMGLPLISIALLTVAFGLPQAMALLLVPAFVTNIWQALAGRDGLRLLRRLWPFFAAATIAVWPGTLVLIQVDAWKLSMLLGGLLFAYALVKLLGASITITPKGESWLAPAFGVASGLFTGMTGVLSVPGVFFLEAIGLPKEQLVQSMGILFVTVTTMLALSLGAGGLLSADLGIGSLIALVPGLIGMAIGQRIRARLPEVLFRRIFFIALAILGAYIVGSSLLGA
ncbi:MAG: sulfite exporter TauE/SafE family protein [Pseudomonadota bacterium]